VAALANARSAARLRYWLGPWASSTARPAQVAVRPVDGLPPGSRLYTPTDRAPRGGLVISPGLHYDGPGDPRMDRLARILATAGFVVLSPASPDLMQLALTPSVIDDLVRAVDALLAAPELPAGARPALFSVSVGSLAALRVAAMPRFAHRISQLVVFGGFADPVALMRALTQRPRDPLNQPLALLTLLMHGPDAPCATDAQRLRDAWHRMIRATWPRGELKRPGSTGHHPIALALAAELPARLRPLFLVGCGVQPGAWSHCASALARDHFAYLDPRPHLATLTCPVTIIHGVADNVIPFEQAGALAAALPAAVRCTVLPTGLIAHSSTVAPSGRPLAVVRELHQLHRICCTVERCM